MGTSNSTVNKMTFDIGLSVDVVEMANDFCIISTNEHSRSILGYSIVVQGKDRNEAESQFWTSIKISNMYHKSKADKLDCYKPFSKGEWSQIGGKWIILFGIQMYIRYGRSMRGGFYVPLTKLNITVSNLWKRSQARTKIIKNGRS